MTRQSWTAVISAICFVALAAVIALVPVPFVSWAPGVTYNVLGDNNGTPVVQVNGVDTTQTTGELQLTTVSVTRSDSHLSLPEAFGNYLFSYRDVLPRDWVYPVGMSSAELAERGAEQMDISEQNATVAALRAAGIAVQENPVVDTVSSGGPAYDLLQTGDVVESVNGTPVENRAQVEQIISALTVGTSVEFGIVRNGTTMTVAVTTQANSSDRSTPRIGITLRAGYRYEPEVSFAVDQSVEGSSAGLMLALAIYDIVSPDDLVAGRIIAGTGTIDVTGTVGSISGVAEKMRGAEQSGATIFLVPAANCSEARTIDTTLDVVKVNKLEDAVSSLNALQSGDTNAVSRC